MKAPWSKAPLLPLACLAVAVVALCAPWLRPRPLDAEACAALTDCRGAVKETRANGGGHTFVVEIDSVGGQPWPGSFKVAVFVPAYVELSGESSPEPYGRVWLTAPLRALETDAASLPDCLNPDAALLEQGVTAKAVVAEAGEFTGHGPAGGWANAAGRLRLRLVDAIVAAPINDESIALLAATLAGDTSLLGADTRNTFALAGLAHVLALSGLHLAVIAWWLGVLLLPLYLWGWRTARYLLIIVAVWAYAFLTGLHPPIVRACVMLTATLLGLLVSGRRCGLNSLCLAALVILAFDPRALFGAGFMMTFAATAGLLLVRPALLPAGRAIHPLLRWPLEAVALGVAVMIATAVLSLWQFHRLPLAGLLANVAAGALTGPLLGGGIAVTALSAMGVPCGWLGKGIDLLTGCLNAIARTLGSDAMPRLDDVWLSPLQLGVLAAATLLTVIAVRNPRVRWRSGLVAAMLVAVAVVADSDAVKAGEREAMLPYIVDDRPGVMLVCPRADTLYVLPSTGIPAPSATEVEATARRYFGPYMSRRGLHHAMPMPDPFVSPLLSRHGPMLAIEGELWLVAADDVDSVATPEGRLHVLAIGNGFRGDPVRLARQAGADSVALLPWLHPALHTRYANELAEAGFGVKTRLTASARQ